MTIVTIVTIVPRSVLRRFRMFCTIRTICIGWQISDCRLGCIDLVANPIVSNLINMIVTIVSHYSANVSKRVMRCLRYVHFQLNLKLNQYDRDSVISLRFCSNFKMRRTTHVMHSRKVYSRSMQTPLSNCGLLSIPRVVSLIFLVSLAHRSARFLFYPRWKT